MAFSFNGTTMTFDAGPIVEVISIDSDISATEIEVGNASDTTEIIENGRHRISVTVDTNGQPSIDVDDTGALAVTWGDTTTTTLTLAICTAKLTRGSKDTGMTTTLTFKPTQA